ncbi:MAG: lysylphosphatidylglycerol synthase domain-containing protein [Planctomycetota bacterium]
MGHSDAERRLLKAFRTAGWVLGLGLLAGAVVFAAVGVAGSGLEVAVNESPGALSAVVGLVGVNLLLTAALFWAVTRGFDAEPPVPYGRMLALTAASGLLNYVPAVRAGLWGRAAYLRRFHGLAVRQSVLSLGVVLGLAVVVVGGVGSVLLVGGPARWWLAAAWVGLATMTAGPVAERVLRRPMGAAWPWAWAGLRALDLAAAAGRLWLAMRVVGAEVGFGDAVVLASASLLVKLVGLTPNGLGLSEWVVAALGAAVAPVEAATAAAAALLDRAAEAVVLVGGGTAGLWTLRRSARSVA